MLVVPTVPKPKPGSLILDVSRTFCPIMLYCQAGLKTSSLSKAGLIYHRPRGVYIDTALPTGAVGGREDDGGEARPPAAPCVTRLL